MILVFSHTSNYVLNYPSSFFNVRFEQPFGDWTVPPSFVKKPAPLVPSWYQSIDLVDIAVTYHRHEYLVRTDLKLIRRFAFLSELLSCNADASIFWNNSEIFAQCLHILWSCIAWVCSEPFLLFPLLRRIHHRREPSGLWLHTKKYPDFS
jgi:hypothetical protein